LSPCLDKPQPESILPPFAKVAGRKRGQRSAQRRINSRVNRGMAWFKRVHRPNAPVRGLSKNKPPSATATTIPHKLHYASIFFTTDGHGWTRIIRTGSDLNKRERRARRGKGILENLVGTNTPPGQWTAPLRPTLVPKGHADNSPTLQHWGSASASPKSRGDGRMGAMTASRDKRGAFWPWNIRRRVAMAGQARNDADVNHGSRAMNRAAPGVDSIIRTRTAPSRPQVQDVLRDSEHPL